MHAILHYLWNSVVAATLAAPIWALAQATVYIATIASVSSIRNSKKLAKNLSDAPRNIQFVSNKGTLTAIMYDKKRDQDSRQDIFSVAAFRPSLLRWNDGKRRSIAVVRQRLRYEIGWQTALFTVIPFALTVVLIYFSVTIDWRWVFVALYLVIHQVFFHVTHRLNLFKFGPFILLSALIFLHRTNWGWGHLTVYACTVVWGCWALVSITVLTVMLRIEDS